MFEHYQMHHGWTGTTLSRKAQVAEVEIEELYGELLTGVKTRSFADVETKVVTYPDVYYSQQLSDLLCMESRVFGQDIDNVYTPWRVFAAFGVKIDYVLPSIVDETRVKNLCKITQRFSIKKVGGTDLPYVQFYCNLKKVKYVDNVFEYGDIMTLFLMNNDECLHRHQLPLLTVAPKAEQTFIPLSPKQKLQVITTIDSHRIHCGVLPTSLKYLTTEISYGGLRCDYFECVKLPNVYTAIISHYRTANKYKTIIVPIHDALDFPIISDPVDRSLIYTHNVKGFVLCSYKNMSINHNKCPVKTTAIDTDEGTVMHVTLKRPVPYVVIERYLNSWTIRLPYQSESFNF